MKSSFFALVSSMLIALAFAYTTPVGDPTGNPIYKPGLQEQVPIGKPYTITWDPTTTGTVTIVLLRGPGNNIKQLYPIAKGIDNSGKYIWTPATDLEIDVTHYGLQLIVDATGQYQYSTQFGISSSSPPPSSSMAPAQSYAKSNKSSAASNSSIPITTKLPGVTTVVQTVIMTISSCNTTVLHCPYQPTVASLPVPTYWRNSTNTTTTPCSSSRVASTGFISSTNAMPPQYTGAGDKIRVGCAMGAVIVAAFVLAI